MNQHITVLGDSGTGKTTWKKKYLIPLVRPSVDAIFICDTKGYEYRDVADVTVEHPRQFREAVKQGYTVIRWVPEFNQPKSDEAGDALDLFIAGVDYAIPVCPNGFVADVSESHNYQRSNTVYSDLFARAVREWRDMGGAVWQDTQYSTDLHGMMYGSGHLVCFQVPSLHDKAKGRLDYSEKEVRNLALYHYIHNIKQAGVSDKKYPPIDL